jgi:hypothetical protein
MSSLVLIGLADLGLDLKFPPKEGLVFLAAKLKRMAFVLTCPNHTKVW